MVIAGVRLLIYVRLFIHRITGSFAPAAVVLDSDTSGFPPLDEVIPQVRDSAASVDARTPLVTTASAVLAGRDDAMAETGRAVVAPSQPAAQH